MAILKKVKQTKAVPEALCEFPNPDMHEAGPAPFEHCPCPPKKELHLCADFNDAVAVCEQIYLNPGETHTEFYLTESDGKKVYHCVIAVGNINSGKGHLYLSDTGSDSPISEQIANISTQLGNVVIKVNEIYNSVEELNNIVEEHSESIVSINSTISEINDSILSINASINKFDERLIELEKLTPISDTSIISLFHSPIEDALTVNLCCYTEAGRVEVSDVYDEYKDRVADCTSVNEYKTYNIGEHAIFTAVANEGYKFVKWFEDTVEYSKDSSIKLEFNDNRGDINVIGTLNDGVSENSLERAPLKNGYTALFKKLPILTIETQVSSKDDVIDLTGDKVIVKVNNIVKEGTSIYVEEGDMVEVTAISIDHHKFLNFNINGVDVRAENNIYKFEVTENTSIKALFEEIKYSIHGEPNVASYGNIIINPHKNYVIEGTSVELEAKATSNYEFKKWVLDDSDPWYEDEAHKDWESTDNPINIVAGDAEKDWDINAVFEVKQ